MKKTSIILYGIIVIQFMYSLYLNNKMNLNTQCIKDIYEYAETLDKRIETCDEYTKAGFFKKDVQLYLMNSRHGNPKIHKMVADSCKLDCDKYTHKYINK